jgi:signal transduction histidine kinase
MISNNITISDNQPIKNNGLKISIIILMASFFFLIVTILILVSNSESVVLPLLILLLVLLASAITIFVIYKLNRSGRSTFNSLINPVSEDEVNHTPVINNSIFPDDCLNEKKHFMTILSHDIRSPLSSIMLITSMIKQGNKYPDINHFMEMIEKSARKELDMLGDLLILLLQSDQVNPDLFEEVLLIDLIDKSVNEVNENLLKGEVNLKINIAKDLKVYVNPDSFGLVLSNLLMNAIQFSPPDQTVEIHSSRNEQCVFIEVKDLGIGFKQETEKSFFKLANGTNKDRFRESSKGIGLYFCRKIMRNHKGTIDAFSDGPSRGARFELTLPVSSVK